MDRIIQRSADIDIFPVTFGKLMTDQRSQTVSCNPVTSDTDKDDFVPGAVNFCNTFF